MAHLIDKSALVVELEKRLNFNEKLNAHSRADECNAILSFLDTLEVKEVDFGGRQVWHEVDSINHPNVDKNKIYCVQARGKVLLAKVIEHPHDDELLQWKCTEFPNHRYLMCEGDKYFEVQI